MNTKLKYVHYRLIYELNNNVPANFDSHAIEYGLQRIHLTFVIMANGDLFRKKVEGHGTYDVPHLPLVTTLPHHQSL